MMFALWMPTSCYFYPRPPRGGRLVNGVFCDTLQEFLSTPSARRATSLPSTTYSSFWNFYPRPPRGGRPFNLRAFLLSSHFYPRPPRGGRPAGWASAPDWRAISIHALREEGDLVHLFLPSFFLKFLSTPSARRATIGGPYMYIYCEISIHALREEGDRSGLCFWRFLVNFYPRPPRGGRHGLSSQTGCG